MGKYKGYTDDELKKKREYMRKFRKRHPTLDSDNYRKKLAKEPGYNKRKYAENREKSLRKARNSWYKKAFGITLADYERMFEEQSGACAICRQPEVVMMNGKIMRLAVDHSHKTQKARGLLCQKCNGMIGLSTENEMILRNAIDYLARWEAGN